MALESLDDLREALASMEDDERAAFLQNYIKDYMGESGGLDEQAGIAAELRGTAEPGMIDTGRYKVAASPLATLGAAGSRGLGSFEGKRVREKREESSAAKESVLKTLIEKMLQKQDKTDRDIARIAQNNSRPTAGPAGLPTGGSGVGTPLPVARGGIPRAAPTGLGSSPYST